MKDFPPKKSIFAGTGGGFPVVVVVVVVVALSEVFHLTIFPDMAR